MFVNKIFPTYTLRDFGQTETLFLPSLSSSLAVGERLLGPYTATLDPISCSSLSCCVMGAHGAVTSSRRRRRMSP